MMGVERKSMVISEKEKEITAYHEMGHALVQKKMPKADPVHKVTIIPRGRALGLTSFLPTEDLHTFSKEYIETQISTLLAGRAAEKLIFNQLTTGASNDLERATSLARKMVCDWGMSEKIGPVKYANQHEEVFLGREISQPRDHSELTAQLIDDEVRRIILENSAKADKILSENIELLHKCAKVLLEREILDGEELDMLINGTELPPISKTQLNAMRAINFENLSQQPVKN
jgi:cell division protease FtsH